MNTHILKIKNRNLYCSETVSGVNKSCQRHLVKWERTVEEKDQAAKSQQNYYERKKNDPEYVEYYTNSFNV